ncbi:hypothetical protein NC652_039791 [Populus alba x Populus x berolinensis]|nr:hypothetical protein NC652_039791 [Populus alba x Populus x berolinensis]
MSTTLTQQVLDEFLYTRTYSPVVELDLLAIRTKRQSVDALVITILIEKGTRRKLSPHCSKPLT